MHSEDIVRSKKFLAIVYFGKTEIHFKEMEITKMYETNMRKPVDMHCIIATTELNFLNLLNI